MLRSFGTCRDRGGTRVLLVQQPAAALRFPPEGNDATPPAPDDATAQRHGSRRRPCERVCRPPGSERRPGGCGGTCGAYSGVGGDSGPVGAVRVRAACGAQFTPCCSARCPARCALRGKESLPAVKYLQVLPTLGCTPVTGPGRHGVPPGAGRRLRPGRLPGFPASSAGTVWPLAPLHPSPPAPYGKGVRPWGAPRVAPQRVRTLRGSPRLPL